MSRSRRRKAQSAQKPKEGIEVKLDRATFNFQNSAGGRRRKSSGSIFAHRESTVIGGFQGVKGSVIRLEHGSSFNLEVASVGKAAFTANRILLDYDNKSPCRDNCNMFAYNNGVMKIVVEYKEEDTWEKHKGSFQCANKAYPCTLEVVPPITTNQIRLVLNPSSFCGNEFMNSCTITSQKPFIMHLAVVSLTSKFGWDRDSTRAAITEVLRPTHSVDQEQLVGIGLINCTGVLDQASNAFESWTVPSFGTFVQDPPPAEPEIMLAVGNETWKAIAAKKKLTTPGECTVEKSMLCFTAPKHAQQCCVGKTMHNLTEDQTMLKRAAARLRMF